MAVGLGGIWVEVLQDTCLKVLPVDETVALRMLTSLYDFPHDAGDFATRTQDKVGARA